PTSSNAVLPSSLYALLSSRFCWTSSTPSFAFAAACSAAAFALSRNPIAHAPTRGSCRGDRPTRPARSRPPRARGPRCAGREGPADADGAAGAGEVVGERHALGCEQLPLEPTWEAARHLDLHRDVARDERHRDGLRREAVALLKRDDDRRRLPLPNRRFHRRP